MFPLYVDIPSYQQKLSHQLDVMEHNMTTECRHPLQRPHVPETVGPYILVLGIRG